MKRVPASQAAPAAAEESAAASALERAVGELVASGLAEASSLAPAPPPGASPAAGEAAGGDWFQEPEETGAEEGAAALQRPPPGWFEEPAEGEPAEVADPAPAEQDLAAWRDGEPVAEAVAPSDAGAEAPAAGPAPAVEPVAAAVVGSEAAVQTDPPATASTSPRARTAAPAVAVHETAGDRETRREPAAAPRPRIEARLYRVREVAVAMATFAAVMLAFDAEGLLTWARRMEAGAVQDCWLAALAPLYRASDAVGLTAPKQAALRASQQLARELGGGEDPLFADAWKGIGELSVEPVVEELDWPDTDDSPGDDLAARLQTTALGDGTATVLLIGDSLMAGSLGAVLAQSLAADPRLRVVRAHQIGTGLSRPDLFDWPAVTVPLIERERPRIVIVSLGGNDAQRIRHKGELLSFGSKDWTAVYRRRVRAMMQTLAGPETRVLWLGLPPMRDQAFSRRVEQLNRVFAAAARKVPRVDYMELGMLLTGRDEGYTTFVRGQDGRLLRVRMEDGIHYTAGGARLVAPWVVDWVYEVIGRRPDDG